MKCVECQGSASFIDGGESLCSVCFHAQRLWRMHLALGRYKPLSEIREMVKEEGYLKVRERLSLNE